MSLIDKFTNRISDLLFIFRLRPLFMQHRNELKKIFERPGTNRTYWIECITENYAPPEKVKIVNIRKSEINPDAKDLVKNWQVLPKPIRDKLTTLIKHLVMCRKLWRRKNYIEYGSHDVSDHVYEM